MALAGILAGVVVPAAAAAAVPPLSLREVADGIFVRFGAHEEVTADNCGAIANIGCVVGRDSVAVVDTGSSHREGEALRKAIAAVTDRPVSHVIATHVHFDHCFGHSAFSDLPVRFIGHRNLPRALAERADFYTTLLSGTCPAFAGTVIVPPDETVESESRIDLGGRVLRLEARPTAHTNTDLTVFDERTGTLFTGDLLFESRLPTLDGSLLGWIDLLDGLLTDDVRRVVPGHGTVGEGRAALAVQRRYLEALRDGVRRALADDLDIPEALARLEALDLQGWQVVENVHGRNVVTAYTELEWE